LKRFSTFQPRPAAYSLCCFRSDEETPAQNPNISREENERNKHGEQIYEANGKRTGRRVLSVEGGFKLEVSFEGTGKLVGVEVFEVGTYTSGTRPDGSLYGEGQGVMLAPDGSTATWKGSGVGKILQGGNVSYRGAVYYSSASPKFTRLNSVAQVFEFEASTDGVTRTKGWEWK
jgi:hypothetical protein